MEQDKRHAENRQAQREALRAQQSPRLSPALVFCLAPLVALVVLLAWPPRPSSATQLYLARFCRSQPCSSQQQLLLATLVEFLQEPAPLPAPSSSNKLPQTQSSEAASASECRNGQTSKRGTDSTTEPNPDASQRQWCRQVEDSELKVVRDQRLSTPKQAQGVFGRLEQLLVGRDPYEGADDLLTASGGRWSPSSGPAVLTVAAATAISPALVEIESFQEAGRGVLIGLLWTAGRELKAFPLGDFGVQAGRTAFDCSAQDCYLAFDMIMLLLEPMHLQRLRVLRRTSF